MIRRRPTGLPTCIAILGGFLGGVLGVLGGVLGVLDGVGVGILSILGGFLGIVGVLGDVLTKGRGHSVRARRTRSSGLPGGVGWLRVSRGGSIRRLLRAGTSVDRLVDYLLDRSAEKLPAVASARFAEEWRDHRKHYSGWRLVWWALCVRATAMRTVAALGPTRLPRDS